MVVGSSSSFKPQARSNISLAAPTMRPAASRLTSERIFLLLISFRFLNALTLRTFFQPDEYYQALEPGWSHAFGGGSFAWITWEWHQRLRSSLHPTLFALTYRIAAFLADAFSLSANFRAELLLAAPKAVQAVIAAVSDLYTWKLACKIYGHDASPSWAALVLTVVSPWQWFCSTRTFSNCLETSLTVMALYNWPFTVHDMRANSPQATGNSPQSSGNDERALNVSIRSFSDLRYAILFGGLATILRPTNAIIWLSLASHFIVSSRDSPQPAKRNKKSMTSRINTEHVPNNVRDTAEFVVFFKQVAVWGLVVFMVSVAQDINFYKTLTFPPWNFLVFNVFRSLALFYGNNDWHYYLSQGYPLLLTTALPFMLFGMYEIFNNRLALQHLVHSSRGSLRGLAIISLTLPAAFSVLSHKEVRFIYPLLPAFHVIAALPVSRFFVPTVFETSQSSKDAKSSSKLVRRSIFVLLLSVNIIIAIYTSQVHNSGILSISTYLRQEFEAHYAPDYEVESVNKLHSQQSIGHMTVAFLMPCHSVPWRSHLQYPPHTNRPGIQAWALTCEPPLHMTDPALKSAYKDEADIFYENPKSWLRNNMVHEPPRSLPANAGRDRIAVKLDPGVYADSQQRQRRNAKLRAEAQQGSGSMGHDITDLLPYLSTSPTKSLAESSPQRQWPHYLVFFQHLEPLMTHVLRGSGYKPCWRAFNSHWHDDWRRTGDVIVWCLRDKHIGEGYMGSSSKGSDRIDSKMPLLEKDRDRTRDASKGRANGKADTVHKGGREQMNRDRTSDRESSGQRMLRQLTKEQNQDQDTIYEDKKGAQKILAL